MSKTSNRVLKSLLLACGFFFVSLAMIGIVFPVLPTTPFLLLAAACFAKSSERHYNWLMTNKLFGNYLKNYQEGHGIPLKVKATSIIFLWVTMLASILFFIESRTVKIILIIIAVIITIHIAVIKTYRKHPSS